MEVLIEQGQVVAVERIEGVEEGRKGVPDWLR